MTSAEADALRVAAVVRQYGRKVEFATTGDGSLHAVKINERWLLVKGTSEVRTFTDIGEAHAVARDHGQS